MADSDPVITIRPTDDTRARFIMRDGTIVTVHFRDGELRACSSRMIAAAIVHPNVIKLEVIKP